MHLHHIKPRHMGGTDDPSNLIELTVEEHAEAHRQLFLKYGRWEDEFAWKGLLGLITKEEIVREVQSRTARKTFTGRPKTEEHKRKISQSKIGKSPCVWYTNGIDNLYILKTLPAPEGYRKGRTLNRNTKTGRLT